MKQHQQAGVQNKRTPASVVLQFAEARLIPALQIGALLTIAVLEYLSGYRAGVMHHLYYDKVRYLNSWYHPDTAFSHLAVTILAIATVILARKRTGKALVNHEWIRLSSFVPVTGWVLVSPSAQALNSYAYLLMSIQFCILLELMRIGLHGIRHKIGLGNNAKHNAEVS